MYVILTVCVLINLYRYIKILHKGIKNIIDDGILNFQKFEGILLYYISFELVNFKLKM
jgi:hypothetical protein